jgi:hypothetical protein
MGDLFGQVLRGERCAVGIPGDLAGHVDLASAAPDRDVVIGDGLRHALRTEELDGHGVLLQLPDQWYRMDT